MGDSIEMERLRMENDFAYIFGKPTSQPINDPLPDPEVLNMRNVNYLQLQLKTITMAGKQDKPIQVTVRIPMIRNGDIDYQTHQTYDIGKNGKQILFNAQFRSNFQLNDKIMGQLNTVVVYFQITSLDTEIGRAEFPLQNMIADGLKSFTYTVSATQTIQQKGKKGGKIDKVVETALIEFDLQLQDLSGRENQQVSPKKEIDIEEQTEKIKEQILYQMQREKEKKQQAKQQQQYEINQQIIQQLSAFQLYLKIGKLVHINREQCLAKVNDDQLNLYIKFKSYGTSEINQTETNWNAHQWILNYPVTCSVTFDSVNKMFNIPWIIELWTQHTQTNEDILIGITRLQLSMINASIFTHNPLISINILKSNLYPLMLYDQDIPFEDLRTKKTMAIFRIKTAFGTTAQIARLVNQEIPIQREPTESDQEPEEVPITEVNEPEKPPESPIEQKQDGFEKFTLQDSLLTILNKITQTIRILPKEQYILKEEFIEIVSQLCNANFNKRIIESLSQYIQLDQQTLDWHIFLQSWQAFSNYKKQLQQKYTKIYASFYSQAMKIFPSINAMERELPHGAFGLLDQQELREFLLNCKGGNSPSGPSFSAITINSVFETLEINEQVQLADLVDYLRQFELYGEISKMYLPIIQIASILEKNIQIWVQSHKQLIDQYLEERDFKQDLKAFDIIQIFQDLGLSVTLLDAVVIMNQIGDYNNVEDHDGQKVCTEIAFWKYIDWLHQTEVVIKEPLSPLKPPQPKVNGTKVPQPIDFQFLETKLIIDLVQISYIEGEKYQIQLQLENTAYNVATPKTQILNPQFYENGQIPINLRAVCTMSDKFSHDFKKTLIERLQYSGLSIMLFKDNQILRGSVAIEEILCIQEEKETFFVQLFDEIKHSDTSLIEFKISIKQTVKDEKPVEGFQLYNTEGQIPLQPVISTEEILEIINPEISHTFRINIRQINWFKNIKFDKLKVKVSLATDKKILKEAIPCFTSDDFNNDFDIVVEYQVKCDQVLATQISKCHLQIQLILQSDSQNKTLIGYLPIKPLFEDQKVAGEIPLDDSSTGAFACTLTLDATYSTDRVEEQVVKNEEKLKFQKKVIIRVMEMILLDYNNELGEIYFMLVDPLNMSESYEVRPNTPSILNTQDCVFIISENELQSDVVELQVRSVMLGEDKIIGNVLIQLSQIQNEGIYSESNYLRVDTKIPDLQARLGIKIIYICATETCNDNYLNAFRYPAIRDLENQNLEQYLRNKLQFSYSEINFMTSLIKDEIFSTQIIQPLNIQADRQIVLDLLKEFAFYDSNNSRYVNPNVLGTVFGYFQMKDCRDQFIQSIHKRKPNDHECPSNQFDYLTFLAHLQKSIPNASPLFQVNIQGPIQHEVQQVIKKTPQKQPEEPKPAFRQLHFHFECGKNLNSLSKRVPNAILKFPQLDQESNVFYSSSNPEFDALVSVDASKLKNLQIQIFDKKYNPVDDKQIYKNILIGEAVIEFSQLKPTFPQILTLQLNSADQSFTQTKIPYLQIKVWTENEEIVPIKRSPPKPTVQTQKETVRKLVFDQDENEKGQENSTIKNLQKELDDYLRSLKKPKEEEEKPKQEEEKPKQEDKKPEQSKPKKIEKVKYSSSGSSSQPPQPKSSSSGNRLEKIDEKLPINGEHLKRIEKILRQNNLPVNKYDQLSDDSDYE